MCVYKYIGTFLQYLKPERFIVKISGCRNQLFALQGALKFNGGGHINHDIFWTNLAPTNQGGGDFPSGKLYDDLIAKWGSVEAFQKDMAAKTAAVQGSGWGWLGYDKVNKSLKIQTCANQDPLEATTGLIPLLGIDVWEHAYYLQYKNVRPDYLNEIWKIVNWQNVAERYNKAQ
ncbi:superoxide dismutase [Mn], mitochondrial [Sphaeroforma arctica JP610]|uniref:superoxide dismutase n=1 Tax=Sphaeroforma arctica JP610 TaxID=667725 RepID=A0A0L0GCR8_9EUKA|nr:superoxide dismutase [Mn], mitochondrial [Sphaeroforma arctica JP610]KNC86810.1 superoxide dismutase [Mn], mitochondrial [Sphaeroforma arctica JP610]|eukprot:XP_014160712.1 superoxide dismutase [Mn], mitochondrial [Sphaeroforma arctica JP610]